VRNADELHERIAAGDRRFECAAIKCITEDDAAAWRQAHRALAARERGDGVAAIDQLADEWRAEIAGAARDEDVHAAQCNLPLSRCRMCA
jgi:hypothetical protein